MRTVAKFAILVGALLVSLNGLAQAPSGPNASATGLCRDGTVWTNATKKGACRGHQGIKQWYADSPTSPTAPASATLTPPPAAAAPSPSPTRVPADSPPSATTPPATTQSATHQSPAVQAPGGAPGLVWVNTSSNVYHCSADRWYGKTKHGAYMSEADAVAKGNRPDHGKACK